ncbi:MAG: GTPase [Anaerolineae bacterium]
MSKGTALQDGPRGPVPAGLPEQWLESLGLAELKRLLALLREQYAPLTQERRTVCIAGPVNTGKSSLYNVLLAADEPRALVSPVPGSTRQAQVGDADGFWVVDTPGANEVTVGAEGPHGAEARRAEALSAAAAADLLVVLFDASRGVAADEVRIYDELAALGKPMVVALNKIDLVRRDEAVVLEAASRNLGLPKGKVLPISATRRLNLDRLLLAIIEADPALTASLAALLPRWRWLLAQHTIARSCTAAATANLITAPIEIPFASFVPITAIQIAMVLRLARVFGFRLGPWRAKEVVLTLGSGLLGRTVFYQLVNLVPIAGYVLGTAVAAGTTGALGYAVAAWFAYGERPSAERVRRMGAALSRQVAHRLQPFRQRGEAREHLQQAIEEALAASEHPST